MAKNKNYQKGKKSHRKKGTKDSLDKKLHGTKVLVNHKTNWLGTPFPSRMLTHFEYVDYGQLGAPTTGVPVQYVYQINSLYSPGGYQNQQPRYRDQLLGILYNRYRVYGVAYDATFITSGNQCAVACVVPVNGAFPTPTSIRDFAELPHSKQSMVSTTGGAWRCKGYIPLPALTGQTPIEYQGNANYQALYNTSPGETLQLVLALASTTTSTTACDYEIKIKMYVELFDPLEQIGSS